MYVCGSIKRLVYVKINVCLQVIYLMVLVFPLMCITCKNRYLNAFCCLFGGIIMKSAYACVRAYVDSSVNEVQPRYSEDISKKYAMYLY